MLSTSPQRRPAPIAHNSRMSTKTVEENATWSSTGSGEAIKTLADQVRACVEIKNRTYLFRTYKNCFVGSEAVRAMVSSGIAKDEEHAVVLGNVLLESRYLRHVTRDHPFKNGRLFYVFRRDEKGKHGAVGTDRDGKTYSWASAVLGLDKTQRGDNRQPIASMELKREDSDTQIFSKTPMGLSPLDKWNTALLDNVHPPKWIDPKVSEVKKYNLVVIGAGAGGLVTSAAGSGVGGKIAIIEEHLMGGDCLNYGCVPSKALIRASRAIHELRNASTFGVKINGTVDVDFGAIMERMRRLRAKISKNDSCERFSNDLGVDVFIGRGHFVARNAVTVNGKTLRFARAVIASGASPFVPAIPGLKDTPVRFPFVRPLFV